ncbi:DUF768 domain-containing protein [Mesorhizobium loti]|nr:DUF768 domain-containing protein [Mesorhizobium loti]
MSTRGANFLHEWISDNLSDIARLCNCLRYPTH